MYINLPGSYVQLQDGNLTFSAPDLTQSVLVLGTATKGLTSEPFLMSDVSAVVREFGSDSEVARAASEVKKGGASNIYVYRLPGTPPVLSALGADVNGAGAVGITIRTTQESPEAAAKYGVAYRHAKSIATSGTGDADDKSVTAELIIVNLETDTVVWQGTALEGASLDNGEVDVEFDLGDVDPGLGEGAEAESIAISVSSGSRTYTAVASSYQTSGLGTGATVTVQGVPTFGTGAYSATTILIPAGGSLYAVGDQLKVLGTALGGLSAANDLTFDVASVTGATRTYNDLVLDDGDGHNAGRASITVSAGGGYSVTITTPGTGYTAGNIVVDGSLLGGVTSTNDATVAITVNGSGNITGASVTGTGKVRGAVLTVGSIAGTYAAPGATALTYSFSISGITATGTYATGQPYTSAGAVATALAAALTANSEFLKLPFSATADGDVISITADGVVNADGEVVYGASHPWAGYTARPYLQAPAVVTLPAGQGTVYTLGIAGSSTGRASNVGLYPQDAAKPFAVAGGGVYVPLDKVVSGGMAISYGLSGATFTHQSLSSYANDNFDYGTAAEFSAGSTDSNLSLMKRYEKLHTAFENLDLAAFDIIVPYGITIDAKNAADGAEFTISGGAYPAPGQSNDVLGYCVISDNGDYTYTYYWSTTGVVSDLPEIASNGELPESGEFQYREVNFGHLLATYCYENSEDYRTCHGVIGTRLPGSISARGIREYFGKAPTYAYDRESGTYFITDESNNGTGLLGHKFIGGKYAFNDGVKRGGLFLTEDRSLDYSAANIVLDANSKKIDLGKYLSVVALFGTTADDVNTRSPAYITNAATIVAGMLPNLSVIDSLINRQVPGLFVPYRLETKTVDVACGLGLTLAKVENGVPSIADSPTFASPTSDYTRLTTVRIVAKIAEELRSTARPFLGKGLSAIKRNALEAAIGEVLKRNLGDGTGVQVITAGRFKLMQTAEERVLGKVRVDLTLTPVFELRQITFSVNLSV